METRPVIIFERRYDTVEKKYLKKAMGVGIFHQWGSDFEEFDEGAGNYTIAIVEMPNGEIMTPSPDLIQFTDK